MCKCGVDVDITDLLERLFGGAQDPKEPGTLARTVQNVPALIRKL